MTNQLPSHFVHLRGAVEDGPTVVVLGGTHGDEKTGILAVDRLADLFGVSLQEESRVIESPAISGNLFLGYGNPEAMRLNRRGAGEDNDLNRCFDPARLLDVETNTSVDFVRARALAPLLSETDYLFDLHGTSSPSTPFVCSSIYSEEHHRLLGFVPVEVMLTDPQAILGTPERLRTTGTTDAFVNTHGGVAICYESGQMTDESKIDEVFRTVVDLLRAVGSVTQSFAPEIQSVLVVAQSEQKVYQLFHCEQVDLAELFLEDLSQSFVYEPGMQKNWIRVQPGDLLGRYRSGREVRLYMGGILLFPKDPAKIQIRPEDSSYRDSLYYLARRIDDLPSWTRR